MGSLIGKRDGGDQVLNFKEAFEISGFPVCCLVTVSISGALHQIPGKMLVAITFTTGSPWSTLFLSEPCKACRIDELTEVQ